MQESLQQIKCLTFDLDDTLWPLRETIINAEREANRFLSQRAPGLAEQLEPNQLYYSRDRLIKDNPELSHQLTLLRKRVYSATLQELGARKAEADTLADGMLEIFLKHRSEVKLFRGVLETLTALERVYTLGAITNGNVQFQRLPCANLFKFCISAESAGCAKPDRHIFELALNELRKHAGDELEAHEILHVGDDLVSDVEGANNAEFLSCWVDHRNPAEKEHTSKITVQSVNELRRVLLGE